LGKFLCPPTIENLVDFYTRKIQNPKKVSQICLEKRKKRGIFLNKKKVVQLRVTKTTQ
jgi:hypothetical protein